MCDICSNSISSQGATSCRSCELFGTGPNAAKDTCEVCPAGKMSDMYGSSPYCKTCEFNTVSSAPNSTSCTLCNQKEPNADLTACIPCQPGKYIALLSCSQCNNGSYSISPGSSACTLCTPGRFTTNIGSSTCKDCPSGKFYSLVNEGNVLVTKCVLCPSGKYSDARITDRSLCLDCPAGKVSGLGSTECGFCPPGSYLFSSSECRGCPKGQYSFNNDSICSACPSGKFNSEEGSSTCSSCPENSLSVGLAVNVSECFCGAGFYGKIISTSDMCKTCPVIEGVTCPQNVSIPEVASGYYRDPANPLNAFPCIPADACFMTGSGDTICSPLYTGYLCGSCVPLTSYRRGVICKSCPSEASKVLTILGLLLFVLVISWRLSQNLNQIPLDIRMCFSAIQTIALFPGFFSSWPDNLDSFFHAISFTVSILRLFEFNSLISFFLRTLTLKCFLRNVRCRSGFGKNTILKWRSLSLYRY
jgi:hypothetical protein